MAVFICSCRQTVDSSPSENSDKMARHNEIRKIMREHYIGDLEKDAYLTDEEHNELVRLKKDYYADVKNRESHPTLVVPGRGWEIRGPLSIDQFEKELIELYEEASTIRKKVYNLNEKFENSEIGTDFARFKSQYKKGDEIYFFKSDKRSWIDLCGEEGYVLIRKNKFVDRLVTAIN